MYAKMAAKGWALVKRGEIFSRSLLTRKWDVEERISVGNTEIAFLHQEIYELEFAGLAKHIIPGLMERYANTTSEWYRQVDIPGLDAAYLGLFDCIAIRGNMAYSVTYIAGGMFAAGTADADEQLTAILERLAALNR